MKLGDFLNTLAAKNGMQKDPALISVLSNASVANTEVDDTFCTTMDSSLMSLDGAKSNTEVQNHFKPIILKGVDDRINAIAEAYGVDFGAEKSSYKRIELLKDSIAQKIADAKDKGKGGDAEVQRLNGELQKLQSQLTSTTAAKDNEISQLKAQYDKSMLDTLININLTGKNYAQKQIDPETNVMIARTILQNALAKHGAVVVNDKGSLKLMNANAPELEFLDAGNKPVTFGSFADKILAEAKLLEVTAPQQTTKVTISNEDKAGMEAYNDAMKAAMEEAGVAQS